ncbi:MAG: uroporphyrinogen-III synthase [Pseudomonadota bacterium]
MPVLLTRPVADSQRIADLLATEGIETLIWPLTRVETIAGQIDIADRSEAIVFSSANGVRAFAEQSPRRDLPALCVGARTAGEARSHGFETVAHADGASGDLVDLVRRSVRHHVTYARGQDVSADLTASLAPHGITCDETVVYRMAQTEGPPDAVSDALTARRIPAITAWSARNAGLLADSLTARPDWSLDTVTLVAISDQAAAPLAGAGFRRIAVASRPNATQMIAEIRAAVR